MVVYVTKDTNMMYELPQLYDFPDVVVCMLYV